MLRCNYKTTTGVHVVWESVALCCSKPSQTWLDDVFDSDMLKDSALNFRGEGCCLLQR